ncbi:MAG: helix-turn-helix domain-containing protein [Oscillospiraceae bacterium]|jgi:transcriptional regulator with XRE-family HTH domain|nr:helix-turn-helix domain-containing protein [Oscillospiraceae bacterium]
MNTDFSRILTLLRRERGLSQKQAAVDLGISQALLSHYERGIRECGLAFVIRAAQYYHVSCDYLLGCSPDRNGATLLMQDLPEPEQAGKGNVAKGGTSILPMLNKKLLFNSLNILFDLLQRINCKELTASISDFLTVAVYRMFRIVYNVGKKNDQNMFNTPKYLYVSKSLGAMARAEAEAGCLADDLDGRHLVSAEGREEANITTGSLTDEYPLFATSLLNLIRAAEQSLS